MYKYVYKITTVWYTDYFSLMCHRHPSMSLILRLIIVLVVICHHIHAESYTLFAQFWFIDIWLFPTCSNINNFAWTPMHTHICIIIWFVLNRSKAIQYVRLLLPNFKVGTLKYSNNGLEVLLQELSPKWHKSILIKTGGNTSNMPTELESFIPHFQQWRNML